MYAYTYQMVIKHPTVDAQRGWSMAPIYLFLTGHLIDRMHMSESCSLALSLIRRSQADRKKRWAWIIEMEKETEQWAAVQPEMQSVGVWIESFPSISSRFAKDSRRSIDVFFLISAAVVYQHWYFIHPSVSTIESNFPPSCSYAEIWQCYFSCWSVFF